MKSPFQTFAIALAIGAPLAAFAQSPNQPVPQVETTAQANTARQDRPVQTNTDGYGTSNNGGTWQAGRSDSNTISSYSPPIYNAR